MLAVDPQATMAQAHASAHVDLIGVRTKRALILKDSQSLSPVQGTFSPAVRVSWREARNVALAALGVYLANDVSTEGHERDSREIDAATLAGCRAGERAATHTFVVHYQSLVFAFLSRSLGRGPHVEDLAQEVFLRASRALPDFDDGGPARVSTWLLTIAARIAIDARRKRIVPTVPLLDEATVSAEGTPETERARNELGRALEAAARALTPEHRDVFLLADLHGLPMNEIATVLSVPENTAKTRLFRARARLRELLGSLWEGR